MKKLIILTVMLCMIAVSNQIQAACSATSSNTVYCDLGSVTYAHDYFYATGNSDVYFQWHLTNGNAYSPTWVWVQAASGYLYDEVKTPYGQRYFGTMLTTDVSGYFEIWLDSSNGGAAELYAQW